MKFLKCGIINYGENGAHFYKIKYKTQLKQETDKNK
jgi:hypothetical protein